VHQRRTVLQRRVPGRGLWRFVRLRARWYALLQRVSVLHVAVHRRRLRRHDAVLRAGWFGMHAVLGVLRRRLQRVHLRRRFDMRGLQQCQPVRRVPRRAVLRAGRRLRGQRHLRGQPGVLRRLLHGFRERRRVRPEVRVGVPEHPGYDASAMWGVELSVDVRLSQLRCVASMFTARGPWPPPRARGAGEEGAPGRTASR
jgi:hypothetical protein